MSLNTSATKMLNLLRDRNSLGYEVVGALILLDDGTVISVEAINEYADDMDREYRSIQRWADQYEKNGYRAYDEFVNSGPEAARNDMTEEERDELLDEWLVGHDKEPREAAIAHLSR